MMRRLMPTKVLPSAEGFALSLSLLSRPTRTTTRNVSALRQVVRISRSSTPTPAKIHVLHGIRHGSSWSSANDATATSGGDRPSWSDEWKALGLGATLKDEPSFPPNLFFVQLGHGVDQHGKEDATKAAIRAVRNAIEFNSIPGVITHIPGGRAKMLIHVKLGVPSLAAKTGRINDEATLLPVDALQVAKVFPYGQLLPLEMTRGGLSFHTGRVVEELGDSNDVGICVAACISLGYDDDNDSNDELGGGDKSLHKTYNTKDGY